MLYVEINKKVIFDKMKLVLVKKIFTGFFCFLSLAVFCQSPLKVERLKVGDVTKETINYTDSWNTPQATQVPAIYHVLFYRFRDTLGNSDNADSIAGLEKIISELETELSLSAGFKGLHTECHAHVNSFTEIAKIQKDIDEKRAASYEATKISHGWSFMLLDHTKLKINSILNTAKVCLVSPKGRILYTGYIGGLNKESISKVKVIRGKLLTENEGKKSALERASVSIIKFDHVKVDEAFTNKDGEFELDLPENVSYTLTAKPTSTAVDNIILATQMGQELSKFKKTKNGFEFPLLKADISKLTLRDVNDDITLTLGNFSKAKSKKVKVTQSIVYGSGQFTIDEGSKKVLDNVAEILKKNTTYSLEVISHTDSQGDDAANLTLSEKRSSAAVEYLTTVGIERSRLKATGKGEKEIRNRCLNGIDCSKKEHEYNRRTEFNFIKQ